MSMPLLQTKLNVPPLRSQLVPRPQLLTRLHDQARRPLTLVAAPAGFGKTTLVRAALKESDHAVAWLSLDEDDNDLARFFAYLLAALRTQQANLGETVLPLLAAPQTPPAKVILTPLLNDLATLTMSLLLVLDDYHLINAQPIHEAAAFLVDHLPPHVHLIITTRIDPPLPLARWRARNQLSEIRADDLRFLPDEAAVFLNEVMGLRLTAPQIAALETRTEGWIAGLQLAALSMQGRADVMGFIQAFSGSHTYIVDYLVEEVLQRQPERVQRFLLQTAILERLSGPLCDAVTRRSDSQGVLEKLQQSNLFIVSLDDERRWFRYHHLFADVLRARLQQATPPIPDEVAELHRRASRWFEQQDLLGEAIRHALIGGDPVQATRLIERMGMMVFTQGAIHYLLNKWLAFLPAELARSRPKLCLIHAWLLLNRLDPEASLRWLVDAEQALQHADTADDLDDMRNLRGEIAVTQAIATSLSRQFDPEQIKRWAQEALDWLRPDNASYRGLAFGALGTAAMQQGDVRQAERDFGTATLISRVAGHEYVAIATTFHLTNMQRARGLLSQAITTCQQALAWAAEQGAQNSFGAGNILIQLADLLRERNELSAALHHAHAGLALAHGGVHPSLFMVGLLVLVRIKDALGDLADVKDALHQIRQRAANLYHADWILGLLPALEAHVHLRQGDLPAAIHWAQTADWAEQRPPFFRSTHHFVYAHEYGGITRAQVLIAQAWARVATDAAADQPALLADVLAYLERQGQVAAINGWLWLQVKVLALQALTHQALGERAQALARLEQALVLAEPQGYIRIFVEEGEPMRLLLLDFRLAMASQPSTGQQDRLSSYSNQLLDAFDPTQEATHNRLGPPHRPIQDSKLVLEGSKSQNLPEPLTQREVEVVQLLATGLSNQEIADKLVVAKSTLHTHINNIYGKLAVENRMQAVIKSKELGLL